MSWNCEYCEFNGTNDNVRCYQLKGADNELCKKKICDNCLLLETATFYDDSFKKYNSKKDSKALDSIEDLEYDLQEMSYKYVQ